MLKKPSRPIIAAITAAKIYPERIAAMRSSELPAVIVANRIVVKEM